MGRSQRQAADVLGVDHRTVGHDLACGGDSPQAPLRPCVFGKAIRRARLAAGRPKLTLHDDLCHSSDTLAAATGASLPELGHG